MTSLLLNLGVNKNLLNKMGRSALHLAAEAGDEPIVMLLLENGANLNTGDHFGQTPIHLSASNGKGCFRNLIRRRQYLIL